MKSAAVRAISRCSSENCSTVKMLPGGVSSISQAPPRVGRDMGL
jgi:hypothetical protein